MSRLLKFLVGLGIALGSIVILAAIFVFLVVPSARFQNYVREKIVSAAESSSGGSVELGNFHFDVTHLTATLTGFVLHGTEPAGSPPLFEAPSIVLRLKLFARHAIDLEYLGVERPAANVMIFPDGRTNIPAPKTKSVDTIVDLAIARVSIADGAIHVFDRSMPLNLRGGNLRIELVFDSGGARYQGRLSMASIYISSGLRAPLEAQLTIPVVLAKNALQISGAMLRTPRSQVILNADLWNLAAPDASIQASAHIALEEMARAFELPLHLERAPTVFDAHAMIRLNGTSIQIEHASVGLGKSRLDANNTNFRGSIDLAEISDLLAVPRRPSGVATIAGTANLPGQADGFIEASPIALTVRGSRYGNISLHADFHADRNLIELRQTRVRAFGGEIDGNVRVSDLARLQANATLRGFDIQKFAVEFAKANVKYGGVIAGKIDAKGDLKQGFAQSLVAHADLSIAPRPAPIPVSGKLNATYRGDRQLISFIDSRVRLPHSAITLSGVAGEDAELVATSRNLSDFAALPVKLEGGSAMLEVSERGPLANPQLSGSLRATNIGTSNSRLDEITAAFTASPLRASIDHGVLRGPDVDANFTGFVGLHDWKPSLSSPLSAKGEIHNGQLAPILALAGQNNLHGTGSVNASVDVTGTVSNPAGAAQLSVANGSLLDTPFDQVRANVDFEPQGITLRNLDINAPSGHLDAHGSYSQGRLQASIASTDISLARLGVEGTARVKADVLANVEDGNFLLKAVNFNLTARMSKYGEFTAQAATYGNSVQTRIDSNFAGSTLHGAAQTRLAADYPTTAELSVNHLNLDRVIPGRASGTLSGSASFSGTIHNPQASATLRLSDAQIYHQPIRSAEASIRYTDQLVTLESLDVSSAAGNLQAHGIVSHSGFNFRTGRDEIFIATNGIDLSRIAILHERGLAGVFRLNGGLAIEVGEHLLPVRADISGGIANAAYRETRLGDLNFTSKSSGGALAIELTSDLAQSNVHGTVRVELQGDYPATGNVSFAHLRLAALRPLIASLPDELDGEIDGEASGTIPLTQPRNANARLQLSKLELTAQKAIKFQNQGPIVVAIDHSTIRVDQARITGPSTDISIKGSAALEKAAPLNVTADAKIDAQIVRLFEPNAFSGGTLNATLRARGTLQQPAVNGEVQLKDVSLQLPAWPNGIANANGVIQLAGTSARIASLTAESGGGKITVTGSAAYTGTTLDMNFRVNAKGVRARYSGASVSANAALTLTGTSRRSVLGGTVTVTRVGYSQQSDIGSILTASSTPPEVPASPTGILAGMRLNVRIQTAPDVIFQTSLAQQLSANADLTLEGTAGSPGMVGRVNVTGGTLIFFGNKYALNRGTISFYNPVSIDPVLDVDLQTTAQGVQVEITASGPIEDLKLTYRSDPPLKFEDIIALLAAGKTPPDPTIAVNQPYTPDQTAAQMGESAVLGAAVANPAASRLARVFGVSQLTIAPTFVTGSALPQARITITQQVNSTVTFTYSQDLSQTNSQLIRIEWALTPKFSAVATRDENGVLGVDFYYKRQFR